MAHVSCSELDADESNLAFITDLTLESVALLLLFQSKAFFRNEALGDSRKFFDL